MKRRSCPGKNGGEFSQEDGTFPDSGVAHPGLGAREAGGKWRGPGREETISPSRQRQGQDCAGPAGQWWEAGRSYIRKGNNSLILQTEVKKFNRHPPDDFYIDCRVRNTAVKSLHVLFLFGVSCHAKNTDDTSKLDGRGH